MDRSFSLYCTTHPSSVVRLRDLIDEHLASIGEGQEWLADLYIVVDEMASNIEKYAYPGGGGGYNVRIDMFDDAVELFFEDEGVAFDPLAVRETPLRGETDRPVGRMGILLVSSLASHMEYRREKGRNVTRVVLALPGKEIKA
ncbi:MAG: ATP-binding protein [Methanomassiliicoccales archaeon]